MCAKKAGTEDFGSNKAQNTHSLDPIPIENLAAKKNKNNFYLIEAIFSGQWHLLK